MKIHSPLIRTVAIGAAVAGLALAGIVLLTYAIYGLLPESAATPTPVAQADRPTPFLLPTSTVSTPTAQPTATSFSPSPTPAATALPSLELRISQPANVRSGPGLNYPLVGGLPAGAVVPLRGCDVSRTWFVIEYPVASGGDGWVSNLVAEYAGNVGELTVIAAPPPPPPTAIPSDTPLPPTSPPPPSPAPAVYMSRGIRGDAFWVENPSAAVNQDIWFNFKVTNTLDSAVSYSVLAAHCDGGPNAKSWTNEKLNAHQTLEWRDHINIGAPGTYRLYLGICYGGKDACLANAAPWDRLSPDVTVTVN